MNIKTMIFELLVNMIPIIATIYIVVGIKLFKQTEKNGINYFSFLMLASAIYSLGYYLELNCKSLNTFILVRNFEFLGSTFIPSFGILFVTELTGNKISKKITTVLFAVSAFLWLLFISNPLHHLIYISINLRFSEGFGIVNAVRGPAFYSMMTYYTVFLVFSIITLSKAHKNEKKINRKNSFIFLKNSFHVAWVAIIFSLITLDTYIDPVTVTIMILAALFVINEINNDMFELQTIMWKATYEKIGEPAFLIDNAENLVCFNVIANSLFGKQWFNIHDLIVNLDNVVINRTQIFLETNIGIRWFDVKKSSFSIKRGFVNYLLIDITNNKLVEEHLKESEEKYRMIFENAPLGLLYFDNKGFITDCNDNFTKIIGTSRELLLGVGMLKLSDKDLVQSLQGTLLGNITTYEGDYKSISSDKITAVRIIFAPITSEDKSHKAGVGIVEDITERKMFETNLSNEKNLFKTTLVSIGDGVISTDNQGNVLILNKVAEQLTGWTQNEAFEKPLEQVFSTINEFTRERCESPVYKVLATSDIIEIANHTILVSKDKIERPIEDSAAPIKDEKGNINGVVLVFRDFTEKKQRQDEIKYLSFHDQLTGLYNRRFYEEELVKLDTERNLPLTIIMGDVNGLKLINDSFGHVMGDELLIKVAEVLKKGCRSDDIIARLGGDEFIILLPKTDAYEADQIIKRIINFSLIEKVGAIDISISFGCETKNSVEEPIEEIFKKAEDHMYNKKLFESPSMRGKTINAIIRTLHEKNKREEQHSHRVSALCKSMGEALNLPEHEIQELKTVGLLHDIGKIAVAENILNKPNQLIDEEWEEINRHPEIGYRILSTVNDMSQMAEYVLAHHERWDGKGYPKGLKGEEIPFVARIISIADAYDAMTSVRSYRNALPVEVAIAELQEHSGTQFDSNLISIFIEKVLKK
jgi:diguanylate cyclase (GGDEF)-like protein/PAS domain S-box-containing protein